MQRTVNQGFQNFLAQLTPSNSESEAAKNHRESIYQCLYSNFSVKRFFRTGSFGNGTSVSGYSDVDYFAQIPSTIVGTNSTSLLLQVRTALNNRFPRTDVHTDCPAVVCPFGKDAKESTEIVPAIYSENIKNPNYPIYLIPNCFGGWIQSSPDLHNEYVRTVDQKFQGKLKPLIRFIKAWKYYKQVPISSFYIELRVTKYAEDEPNIIYKHDVQRIFTYFSRINLAKMQDPMGISGYINPCKTENHLEDSLSKLNTACSRAEKAIEEEKNGNIDNAFYWWNLLYDGKFPTY